jgi:hypothetical protein
MRIQQVLVYLVPLVQLLIGCERDPVSEPDNPGLVRQHRYPDYRGRFARLRSPDGRLRPHRHLDRAGSHPADLAAVAGMDRGPHDPRGGSASSHGDIVQVIDWYCQCATLSIKAGWRAILRHLEDDLLLAEALHRNIALTTPQVPALLRTFGPSNLAPSPSASSHAESVQL